MAAPQDRLLRNAVSDGYVYDLLGRATTVPARDLPSGVGAVSLGYYDTDAVQSISTSANTETFSLDAAGRRLMATTTPAGSSAAPRTLTRHYTDSSDNPSWVTDTQAATTTTTRYAESLGGDLGASVNVGSGQIELTLANLHGDVVTTVTLPSSSATASSIDAWSDYDEYGNARNAVATSSVAGAGGYGWLGAKQRSDDTIGTGLVLMGARVYNPVTGRFTSMDPVPGGSASSYDYVYQDPVNKFDLNGLCWGWGCGAILHAARTAYRQTVRFAAVVPYGIYYGSYHANRWISRHAAATPLSFLRPGFWVGQAVGLAGDAGLDWVKNRSGFHESIYDEHQKGHLNPFHRPGPGKLWLPGLYKRHGHVRVDWAW